MIQHHLFVVHESFSDYDAPVKTTTGERHCLPLLNFLARIGTKAADGALAPTGLRPRHLVALMLLHDHGPAGQQTLASALALDPRNVVGLLNDLEERALVTRRRNPEDRRRHDVEISVQGRQSLADAQERLMTCEQQLLGALSEPERATLYDLLARAADGHRTASICVADV